MIPTYRPDEKYLRQTIESVLQQDPGTEEMQIEVIDDCSPSGLPTGIVQRLAGGRITFHREEENLGLARIWNRCIERARGNWVHILHQDDYVNPGFYSKLKEIIQLNAAREPGAALCRYDIVDDVGRKRRTVARERSKGGMLTNWPAAVFPEPTRFIFALVVARATYERVGGFSTHFRTVLDYEMWRRIAVTVPAAYTEEVLSNCRSHRQSVTSKTGWERVFSEGQEALDYFGSAGYLPPALARKYCDKARANDACVQAWTGAREFRLLPVLAGVTALAGGKTVS